MIHLPNDDVTCGWYHALPSIPEKSALKGKQSADYAVLGAGFAGLAMARRLAELMPNARIILIDAQRIGQGLQEEIRALLSICLISFHLSIPTLSTNKSYCRSTVLRLLS